jgi:hypothetical protein
MKEHSSYLRIYPSVNLFAPIANIPKTSTIGTTISYNTFQNPESYIKIYKGDKHNSESGRRLSMKN